MSVVEPAAASNGQWEQTLFASAALAVALAACLLACLAPLGVSIVAVFLFAGPHNWFEARYMMTRMPGRWGKLWAYFTIGILGVLLLAGYMLLLPSLSRWRSWPGDGWLWLIAVWNSLLVLWIAVLAELRSRQNPRRQWPLLWPIVLLLIGLNWLWPLAWSLALVYLHPLVALCFLDRELKRCKPQWLLPYRFVLACVPLLLLGLWWRLAFAPPLAGDDILTMQITRHAGANVFSGLSSRTLVATHAFLEMLHYGVWIVAIPLVTYRSIPWRLADVPLARRSVYWRTALLALLAAGMVVVLLLWAGFVADYPLTRDIYFTVALLHVLAEAPFLLRLL